ncbi:hypothetical protein [Treponema pectinovorum]
MAITKIHPKKSTLNLAISYIVNGEKTNEQILVSTHKCHQETAHTQFFRTRNDVEQTELFLPDTSFNPFYREKQVRKWHIKSVLNCVKRY